MSTREVLAIVEALGLRIVLQDGRPVLKRPDGNDGVTDNLLAVLKRHRERIIEHLRHQQQGGAA